MKHKKWTGKWLHEGQSILRCSDVQTSPQRLHQEHNPKKDITIAKYSDPFKSKPKF